MDTELDRIHLHLDTPCKASIKKQGKFGSIERGINKMICMLTPKKKHLSGCEEPRKVKVSGSNKSQCSRDVSFQTLV